MICQRCEAATALPKERFCKPCRKLVLAELKDAGFLAPRLRRGTMRSGEMKEITRETKFGTGHG